jgi:hypothetical protein
LFSAECETILRLRRCSYGSQVEFGILSLRNGATPSLPRKYSATGFPSDPMFSWSTAECSRLRHEKGDLLKDSITLPGNNSATDDTRASYGIFAYARHENSHLFDNSAGDALLTSMEVRNMTYLLSWRNNYGCINMASFTKHGNLGFPQV